jgi:hypothetical protein
MQQTEPLQAEPSLQYVRGLESQKRWEWTLSRTHGCSERQ